MFEETKVGDWVAQDHRTAFVFKSFGIDFCCGGKKSIQRACESTNTSVKDLEMALREVLNEPGNGMNVKEWSASFLVDYIENNHHRYVRSMLPELVFLSEKVARVHGEEQPELTAMKTLIFSLNKELFDHMGKEEQELFPMVKKMEENPGFEPPVSLFEELEDEHETAGSLMKELEILSNGFTPPEGACTSYTIYFRSLKEFQNDLHMHVHLENNVLFPKVRQLASA
jgi:regulator of cell morphogenesis and NO signaling